MPKEQPDLFGDPEALGYPDAPGYVKGSDTSEAAAESMLSSAASIRAHVWHYLRRGPSTCDEVELGLSLSHQTASARIRELVLMGRVYDSGHRRATRSGRDARIYIARP